MVRHPSPLPPPSPLNEGEWWRRKKSTLISLSWCLKGRRRRKRKGAHLEKNCFFILPDAHADDDDDDDVVGATLLPNIFFIFQLASIPSSKSQYRKASLWEKQISSDDDAPAGICVVAVYRSFNNLQALELTQ